MNKVLVGSKATKHWFPEFRNPNDTDYLVDEDIKGEPRVLEYHNVNRGAGLQELFKKCIDAGHKEGDDYITPPELLYTLKLSHCYWPIHWPKTMADILFFQKKGVKYDNELLSLLYKDWVEIHGKKRAFLNKSNEDFFKDKVNRTYIHDDIHRAVAYYDEPMFERIKKNKDLAYCNESLFNTLSQEDKYKLCREEIYVTALERFIIPKDFCINTLAAYRGACQLLLTSMTKGWFPRFIALNWQELNKPDKHPFIQLFKDKLCQN